MTHAAAHDIGPAIGEAARDGAWWRFGLAGLIVCSVHIGLAAAYLAWADAPTGSMPDGLAVIVELAPLPVAPDSQQDLAPGPEMVEAQPVTAAAPTPTEPEDLPPLPPIEQQAEVMLPEAKPETKPIEEEQPPQPVQAERQQPNDVLPAPQTTAAPRADTVAEKPAAPTVGVASNDAASARWRDRLLAKLQQSKRYPSSAEAKRQQGVVTLNFTVDRQGKVLARRIATGSGVTALDEEVLAMIERAQPLPPFPPEMRQDQLSLAVPIRFSLR